MNEAKVSCESACKSNSLCHYANLYHSGKTATCNLIGMGCGTVGSHSSFHLYVKGATVGTGVTITLEN